MDGERAPSGVLGGWQKEVSDLLGGISGNVGGDGAVSNGERMPSDVLGGWYKEVSGLLEGIKTGTDGLPVWSIPEDAIHEITGVGE